ncbi:MAG: type II toxin-antitoxin system VapC family toxin [Leucobacter sp.]|nr:type II toxin-antitoxin system VapC family toxin [Leucobacter sp.]
MRLLLDTHVLLWWLADDERLSARHRELIARGDNRVVVSSVSIAEIAIKSSLGKLEAPDGIVDAVTLSGFELLAFDAPHAEALRHLPWHHRDPFDRMLVAQAKVEHLTLLTVDLRLREYSVEIG